MKKHLRRILIIVVAIITLVSFSSTASAYVLYGGQISGGADNILYWRHSNIYEYRHSLGYGIEYWNGISSEVSVSRTSTQSYSRCDCYWGLYFGSQSGTIARTYHILNNVVLSYENGDLEDDWYWCKIYFNSDWYNYDEFDYAHRKGIACHEYGHFLGLDHSTDDDNIMYPWPDDWVTRSVYDPSSNDEDGLIAIYGS